MYAHVRAVLLQYIQTSRENVPIVGRKKHLLKGDSYFEVLFSSQTEFVKRNATCLCIRSSSPFSLLPSD